MEKREQLPPVSLPPLSTTTDGNYFAGRTNRKHMEAISMKELYNRAIETKPPVVDGLLYNGVYLFVGAPKLGKSFFMAQLGYHVSTGKPLWEMPVRKGTVLYLALEDNFGRLKRRLLQMFGTASSDNLFFSVTAKSINDGLEDQLSSFISEHPDTRLIIIDTLQKIRDSGGEGSSYGNDYEIITRLKNFVDQRDLCLLLVHHTRKQQAGDSFDMISGTNGLLGAADGAFIMRKKDRQCLEAVMDVSGRDQQDRCFKLIRDSQTLQWEIEAEETDVWENPTDPILEEIDRLMTTESAVWHGTSTDLVEALTCEVPANALTRKLNDLAEELYQQFGIRYSYSRNHEGRMITLVREDASQTGWRTAGVSAVSVVTDIEDPKNTDTTDTTDTELASS